MAENTYASTLNVRSTAPPLDRSLQPRREGRCLQRPAVPGRGGDHLSGPGSQGPGQDPSAHRQPDQGVRQADRRRWCCPADQRRGDRLRGRVRAPGARFVVRAADRSHRLRGRTSKTYQNTTDSDIARSIAKATRSRLARWTDPAQFISTSTSTRCPIGSSCACERAGSASRLACSRPVLLPPPDRVGLGVSGRRLPLSNGSQLVSARTCWSSFPGCPAQL